MINSSEQLPSNKQRNEGRELPHKLFTDGNGEWILKFRT